jgi:hypothetical protein
VRNRDGFLLLEIMVSIVVITAGLLFVMRVYSTAKTALDRSRTLFKYSLLLEEKMFDLEERGVVEEGKEEGHFPDDLKDYFWRVDAEPLAPQNQDWGDLCSVKMDAFHKKNPSQTRLPEKYSLWTYLDKKK